MKENTLFHSNSNILGDDSIKAILIDSGIHLNSTDIKGRIIGQRNYSYNECSDSLTVDEDCSDENGHGTLCAKIIDQITKKKAEYYIIKVLNSDNKTNSKILTEALNYTLTLPVQVVCLSLATASEANKELLKEVTSKLYQKGKILVSSLANNETTSYPASLEHVIGVRGYSFNKNKYYFNKNYNIQCLADASPVIIKVDDRFRQFRGNSKANALMVGNILNELEDENMDFNVISDRMGEKAERTAWKEEDLHIDLPQLYIKQIIGRDFGQYEQLKQLLLNFFMISNEKDINQEPIWNLAGKTSELYRLLSKIETVFHLDFKESVFTMNDFYCFDNFYLSVFR